MDKDINLCEILKGCPKGTRLWSPIFGDVKFETLSEKGNERGDYVPTSVVVRDEHDSFWFFTPNGYPNISGVTTREVMLFPSKDCRDWDKWKCPKPFKPKKPKFDPRTLKPFDKVLVRVGNVHAYCWFADFVSAPAVESVPTPCVISNRDSYMIIPYNNDTKHLVGTSDEAPEHYRYWED